MKPPHVFLLIGWLSGLWLLAGCGSARSLRADRPSPVILPTETALNEPPPGTTRHRLTVLKTSRDKTSPVIAPMTEQNQ